MSSPADVSFWIAKAVTDAARVALDDLRRRYDWFSLQDVGDALMHAGLPVDKEVIFHTIVDLLQGLMQDGQIEQIGPTKFRWK